VNAPRCVFMGTPELAVPALRRLAALAALDLVITQPDRPAGRHRRLRAPPVKRAALDLGLPVWQPEKLEGVDERLADCELLLVMAYGALLPTRLLRLPSWDAINLHCSLLPRWRGASPLQAAIRAGDAQSGISVMRMVRQLDAGPVYLREAIDLPADVTLPWLHDALAALAPVAVEHFLAGGRGQEAEPQDASAVSYCRKLHSADGHLDFTRPAAELERQVRAYTPVPGCWAEADGQRLGITRVALAESTALPPGAVCRRGDALEVGCGSAALSLLELQLPGKRRMGVADFLHGHAAPAVLR